MIVINVINMRLSKPHIAIILVLGLLLGSINSQTFPNVKASDVTVLSSTGYLDQANYYHVVGEVKNLGTKTYQSITITVNFYDSSNVLLNSTQGETILNVLLPGRRSPFDILLSDETRSSLVDHYSVTVSQSVGSSIPTLLSIINYGTFVDGTGARHVYGTIRNNGGQTAGNVIVVATFYDSSGKVVGESNGYIDPEDSSLAAGGSHDFELILGADRSAYAVSYVLTAESAQYELVSEIPPPSTPPPSQTNLYPPSIVKVFPANNTIGVNVSVKSLNVTASDRDGNAFNLKIVTNPDIGSLVLDNQHDGVFKLVPNKSLSWGTVYIWQVNVTDGKYLTSGTFTFTTASQPKPPTILQVSPADSTQVSESLKTLNFTIQNPEGGPMSYYVSMEPGGFKSQASGVSDGKYSVAIPALQYGTEYTWKLGVRNSDLWTNQTFTFTTASQPKPPTILQVSPADSTQVSESLKTLNFTIQNPEGGPMSYYVSMEPGGFKSQASGVSDGKYSVAIPALQYGTEYTWKLGVRNSDLWTNQTFTFTTASQPKPPTILQVSPADSTQVSESLKTLNFTIQNPEGGPMSYYVSMEPGGFKSQASGVSDGKYSVAIPALQYGTEYTWKLGVRNSDLWTNQTFTFTTLTQPAQSNPALIYGLLAVVLVVVVIVVLYFYRLRRIRLLDSTMEGTSSEV